MAMKESDVLTDTSAKSEPTIKQELVYMERAMKAAAKMGPAGRRWLRRWMDDNFPEDWRW